jgi:hypothetical protein
MAEAEEIIQIRKRTHVKMARVFSALLLFVVSAFPQQAAPSPELTFARLARSSKEYLRDSAELPMHLTFSLSATNAAGRVVKSRHGAVDYDFHGYNSRFMKGDVTLHGWKSRDKSVGTLAGASTIVGMLIPEAEQAFRMQVLDSPDPDIVVAEFALISECHPIWTNEVDLPAQMCGNFKAQLHKDDLSMKSLSFDITGMPLQDKVDYLGQATINRDYVAIDFQKVMLPGDPKPFVVPGRVTCTVETNQGKLFISGEFTVKKIKQK